MISGSEMLGLGSQPSAVVTDVTIARPVCLSVSVCYTGASKFYVFSKAYHV